MAGLQDIKKRIRSVKSTHKLTSAMKLISASRLRQSTRLLLWARDYENSLKQALTWTFQNIDADDYKRCKEKLPWYFLKENPKKPHIICIFGAHKGLCGNYNLLSIREALSVESHYPDRQCSFIPLTAKTAEYFSKYKPDQAEPLAGLGHFGKNASCFDLAQYVFEHMEKWFVNEEAGSVSLVSGHFMNALTQKVESFDLFPVFNNIENEVKNLDLSNLSYKNVPIIEPSRGEVLEKSLKHFILVRIYRSFLESEACEYSARMTMMENSKHNAEELISRLSLQYNRTRQTNITNELIEIIAGASAMAAE